MAKWVPCSVRFPETSNTYLGTIVSSDGEHYVDTVSYLKRTNEWSLEGRYTRTVNVVAWMPLPEPWRGDNA